MQSGKEHDSRREPDVFTGLCLPSQGRPRTQQHHLLLASQDSARHRESVSVSSSLEIHHCYSVLNMAR